MKKLYIYLFLVLFSLQIPSLANDIRDFQIEGMSIGDSLLDYFSEEEIKQSKQNTQYPNDKYIVYQISRIKKLKVYEGLNASIKKNDRNYVIASIFGGIFYEKLEECLKLKKEITKDIGNLFKDARIQETTYNSKLDKSGESKVYETAYRLKPKPSDEAIIVNCNHWSLTYKLKRSLQVAANSEEFAYFLIYEAHK